MSRGSIREYCPKLDILDLVRSQIWGSGGFCFVCEITFFSFVRGQTVGERPSIYMEMQSSKQAARTFLTSSESFLVSIDVA